MEAPQEVEVDTRVSYYQLDDGCNDACCGFLEWEISYLIGALNHLIMIMTLA
jgi:hypothetical protein